MGVLVCIVLLLVPAAARGDNGAGSHPLSVLLLVAALSLLPLVLVMVTSFVKIAVVLHILRIALGTPQVPPGVVITGLALILTLYVMAPTALQVRDAVRPALPAAAGQGLLSAASVDALLQAGQRAKEPLREFLLRHSHAGERRVFLDLARRRWPADRRASLSEHSLAVVVPAFAVGQLAEAFKIGLLIFIPFLVIELLVANVLLALGMHMLPAPLVSLPLKLLLFVMVDGWVLLTQGLVLSYG